MALPEDMGYILSSTISPDFEANYIKIDAAGFAAWNFLVTAVILYGSEGDYDYASLPSLYEVNDGFNMAVAVEPSDLYDYNDIILSQFNELTTENQMKGGVIQPKEGQFVFYGVDKILEYAEEHGLKVRGHGLVYEKAMPAWMFVDADGNEASKELVMQRLETHVRTVVRRYRGRIYCYDLMNEMFGHESWDTRDLSRICGADEYMRKVFQWAHEEDPEAILILNDNYYDIPKKREMIFNYVKGLVDDGVPIHGIGLREHHFIDTSLETIDEYLTMFESIPNFKIFVTELDLCPYEINDTTTLYPDFMNGEVKEMMAKKYGSIFDIYRKHADRIETVGMWNVCDARGWRDTLYAPGRKHFSTLFGYENEPNPAFFAATDTDGILPRWTKGTMPLTVRQNDYKTEGDTLTVNAGAGSTAKLFNSVDKTSPISEASADANGKITLNISQIQTGDNSPDYILEVTENGSTKTDKFTHFTKYDTNYRVTDGFENYSKMYRGTNIMQSNDKYMNDGSKMVSVRYFWNTANLGAAEVVYKIPEAYGANQFAVTMYTDSQSDVYNLYYSEDDETYTTLNATWYTGTSAGGKYQMVGIANSIPQTAKYFKIDMGTSKNKHLKSVGIKTNAASETVNPFRLQSKYMTQNGMITTAPVSGSFDGICVLENVSGNAQTLLCSVLKLI